MTRQEAKELKSLLKDTETKHKKEFKGQSGKSKDFEKGFVNGIEFVRKELIPAYQKAGKD